MKNAIITGITGQDGSYLAELLLEEGYTVIGVCRRSSTNTHSRIEHIKNHDGFYLVEGDITDPSSVIEIIDEYAPDEFYNLAAQSHVGTSFKQPSYTFQVDAVGVLNCLEAIRMASPSTKFYQASTSELYGSNVTQVQKWQNEQEYLQLVREGGLENTFKLVQNERTEFSPNSPYAVAKLAAHNLVRVYRDAYDIHASCGILFNHESERRGEHFVTRKITKWIAEFHAWRDKHISDGCEGFTFSEDHIIARYSHDTPLKQFPKLRLGNVDAKRDWGHAQDYVNAMHIMLQQDKPDDYVIATGIAHSVRDFLKEAFSYIGVDNYEDYYVVDPEFYRPSEVEYLCGNSRKAFEKLGWTPKISFYELVQRMVRSDINNVS